LRFVQKDAGGPNGTRSRSRGVAVDHEAAEHVIHFLCVENPAGFEQWVQPNHPDVASDAIRDMLTTRSVGKLQAAWSSLCGVQQRPACADDSE
jgi:hypothetical protein